jgi:hypothetical protein
MYNPSSAERIRKGKRMAALYRITDPLWKAIAARRFDDVERLKKELKALMETDERKQGRW